MVHHYLGYIIRKIETEQLNIIILRTRNLNPFSGVLDGLLMYVV